MQALTPEGQNLVNDLSFRYNLSADAIIHMLIAVNNGSGTMAQFNSPELGGSGQWMSGGMTMVGDMFNYNLKATVDNLCQELANALASYPIFPPLPKGQTNHQQWWPSELGQPFSSGSQNITRYALFPQRLAIETNGQVSVYDTLDHNIGGVSQQQGGGDSLSFSSQYGNIAINSLPLISGAPIAPTTQAYPSTQAPEPEPEPEPEPVDNTIIDLIEKLSQLHMAGALTDAEFTSKKDELLSRI